MPFVNNLNDGLLQTGQDVISGIWDKASNWISGGVDNAIPGTTPPAETNTGSVPPPPGTGNQSVVVSTEKGVSPLLIGGVAAGVLWFTTHKPLFAGLAGLGGYFLTDKVINKGA